MMFTPRVLVEVAARAHEHESIEQLTDGDQVALGVETVPPRTLLMTAVHSSVGETEAGRRDTVNRAIRPCPCAFASPVDVSCRGRSSGHGGRPHDVARPVLPRKSPSEMTA
jgi:hypothetical protein